MCLGYQPIPLIIDYIIVYTNATENKIYCYKFTIFIDFEQRETQMISIFIGFADYFFKNGKR